VFTVALNGTLTSTDLVNVTVTVPDALARSITNVTAAGYSYISFAFNNVTDVDTFQVRLHKSHIAPVPTWVVCRCCALHELPLWMSGSRALCALMRLRC